MTDLSYVNKRRTKTEEGTQIGEKEEKTKRDGGRGAPLCKPVGYAGSG